ncbi:MAG: hypothetical protein ACI4TQ_07185, partial [Alloprevotella sp.]
MEINRHVSLEHRCPNNSNQPVSALFSSPAGYLPLTSVLSVLRRPFTFRAAGGFATWVFVFGLQLSYFTPHLAVSVREKAVTETGVSRCR